MNKILNIIYKWIKLHPEARVKKVYIEVIEKGYDFGIVLENGHYIGSCIKEKINDSNLEAKIFNTFDKEYFEKKGYPNV
jgi:hypothetical protein